MQLPSTGSDPLSFKDGMLVMPLGSGYVPIDQQDPYAAQYNLAYENQRNEFNQLLKDVFKKTVIIWSLDKTWSKEGDCIVAVFCSKIIKKSSMDTSSAHTEASKVGSIKPTFFDSELQTKEDVLFDEFVQAMEIINQEQQVEKSDDIAD